jgi:CO/xanthine dehydrogenase Mo-binding subunit
MATIGRGRITHIDPSRAEGSPGVGLVMMTHENAPAQGTRPESINATGVRVRDFPITLDKLLAGLPLVED